MQHEDLQSIIHHMTEGKSNAMTCISLYFEGVTRTGNEVKHKANSVSNGVSKGWRCHEQHHQINAILNQCG